LESLDYTLLNAQSFGVPYYGDNTRDFILI